MTAEQAPVRAVVVDDSPRQRRLLRAAVEADGDISVVGEARNGRAAIALVERLRPAVVLLDLELAGMSGLEAIEQIMAGCPTPILVCRGVLDGVSTGAALDALAAGAVDVVAEPGPESDLAHYGDTLRRRVRLAARIRVITHPRGRWRARAGDHPGTPTSRGALLGAVPPQNRPVPPAVAPVCAARSVRLIAVGASTGGPQALATLLGALPADLPQAVLVVQHMAEGFLPGLAAWLDGLVDLPVLVGRTGRRLEPGTVTVAPGGGNLLVRDDQLRVLCGPPAAGQFHVPGIDQTFSSVASALGPDACGVLLTGMGRDGATGLLAMRRRGAVTIGQDEATSAVYGMPAAAAALDAVDVQLPLERIAEAVLEATGRTRA